MEKSELENKLTQHLSLKEKVNFYLNDLDTPLGKFIDFFIIFLIGVLCVTFVISTYSIDPQVEEILHFIEYGIIIIFIIEYVLRFWVAKDKLRHFFNIYSLIDLISIIPFFFTFTNLQFLRIFRVFRVFRVLRFLRFLKDENFFFGTVKEDNLIILRIIFTLFAIIFVSSGLIYYEEYDVKNTKFNTFFDAVYYSIVTMTTVGFGDITPQTAGGKIITLIMIISGIIFLPWQIGTLIRKFVRTLDKEKIHVTCKYCGLKDHDKDAVHCKACGALIYQEYESDVD